MRFALTIIVSTMILIGAGMAAFALVRTVSDVPDALVYLAPASLLVLASVPILVFGALANTTIDPDLPGGRAFYQRLAILSGSLWVGGIVAFIVFVVLSGAAAWIAVVVLASAVALGAAAVLLGNRIRTRAAAGPTGPEWKPRSEEERMRLRRRTTAAFLGGTAVGGVGALAIGLFVPESTFAEAMSAGALALALGCLAATIVVASAMWKMNAYLRSAIGTDHGALKKLARVIVRGRDEPIDDELRPQAARYAAYLRDFLPLQFVQQFFLLGLVILNQASALIRDPDQIFPLVLVIACAALLVVIAPILLRQYRNVLRYLAVHASDIGEPVDSALRG